MAKAVHREPSAASFGSSSGRARRGAVDAQRRDDYVMYDTRTRGDLARCVSGACLAGAWNEPALVDRVHRALGRRCPWTRPLVREILAAYHHPPADRPRELARFIDLTLAGWPAPEDEPQPPLPRRWYTPAPEMGRRRWPVPEIGSLAALAQYLEVSDGELAWLADVRGLERTVEQERLRNYWYGTIARPGGTPRVIERPKHRLKGVQRRILHEVLDLIPAHGAAHGYTAGRSVRTHASVHAGRFVVIRLDLRNFFGSITGTRVYGIFRTAGYPESVSHTLTGIVTNVVPSSFWHSLPRPTDSRQLSAHHALGRQLATPHLPQGSPTSPALANLATFNLDRRLAGLADSLEITYTRYADDLTFSGPASLVRRAQLLRRAVRDIARDEGFTVNESKSTLVTRAGRQRVCGVVVNQHPNISRAEYDRLRAILHNSIVHGPASQNRAATPDFRAHLLGWISWIASLNPQRADKLRREFARISWENES